MTKEFDFNRLIHVVLDLQWIPKCFTFLVIARGVVNIMCNPVISLLAKKARPDQCLESNQQTILSIVSLKLYAQTS